MFGLMLRFTFSFLILCTPLSSFAEDIQKVTIKTVKSGWVYKEQIFELVNQGDLFVGDGRSLDKKVVESLLKFVRRPVVPKLDVGNLEIGKKWVEDNEKVFMKDLSLSQQKLLMAELYNPIFLEEAIRTHYDSRWTDDHPRIEVKIFLKSGVVSINSDSQKTFMLPWTVIEGKEKRVTWDAGISRAVAVVMPVESENYDRLVGNGFADRLRNVMTSVLLRDGIDLEKANDEFGPDLRRLKQKYKIVTATSAIMSGLGFNVTGLHASLAGGELPKGMELDIHLPSAGKKLPGLQTFMAKAPTYVALTESVPWLSDWLKNHPTTKIEINMVDGVSFTDKARKDLVPILKGHRPSLFAEIGPLFNDAALLTITEGKNRYSRWIVLPDRRMLLWHATGKPIFKWDKDMLPEPRKTFGQDAYCVLVTPDGELIKNSEK